MVEGTWRSNDRDQCKGKSEERGSLSTFLVYGAGFGLRFYPRGILSACFQSQEC